jgi:pimeloyl-ACP methyl ester carboxylesterase
MSIRIRAVTVAAIAAFGAAASTARAADVVSIPVSFPVENVNTSAAPCQSDGKPYALHAELVGPRDVLTSSAPATATLYLHEYSFDDFWHFRTVPGVDYATALAEQGHVSVTLDRLGYDDSPRPDGNGICLGAHADMAHQIVEHLRAGTYAADGMGARGFQRIVLGGHSVGAIVAELEAYSFKDVDALMLFGHSDGDYSPKVVQVGAKQGFTCGQGGDGGDVPNYAFFGTPEESRELAYKDTDPAVIEAQKQLRHPDPCGDVNSLIPTIATNKNRAGEIAVPILLLYGRDDGTLAEDAGDQQSQAYTASKDVSTVWFDNASHALTLERVAPQVQASAAKWLSERGFGTPAAPGSGGNAGGGTGGGPAQGGGAPGAGGTKGGALGIRLRGVKRRGCVRRAFTVRVRIATPGTKLRAVRLTLDGRRLAGSRRRAFSRRVAVRRLKPGRHRLVVTTRDDKGNRARAAATFRRCR